MTAPAALAAWLAERTPRERRLVVAAAAVALGTAALGGVRLARDDLAALRARVAGHERELVQVRRLAATLRRATAGGAEPAAAASPLVPRLAAAAEAAVGRERIASMTPVAVAGEERVAVRLAGVSLPELVGLLYAIETAAPPLAVARLAARKLPDDPARLDVSLEVAP